jgi:hypothetical protein
VGIYPGRINNIINNWSKFLTINFMSSKFFSNKNDNKTDKLGKKVTGKGKQVHNKGIGVKKSGRGK